MKPKSRIFRLDICGRWPRRPAGTVPALSPTSKRLQAEVAVLDQLDQEHSGLAASNFGKALADHIVWRELLELELQEIDEQIDRITGAAGAAEEAPQR
jgi:hypothetical protein